MCIPDDQAWFWTPEWQAKEREADADIAAGRGRIYYSDEEFLAALERAVDDPTVLGGE
jgi:antitoxin PrlF